MEKFINIFLKLKQFNYYYFILFMNFLKFYIIKIKPRNYIIKYYIEFV